MFGAEIVMDIKDEDYGGRSFTCRDLEGHVWTFGTWTHLHRRENDMARAVHFEIQASEPQVLIDYYTRLFGWSFNKWEGGEYWLIHTGPEDQPGINGGLLPRRGPVPEAMASINAFVITVDVADIDAALEMAAAEGSGASVVVPKMPVPGIGWLGYARDPDGNIFGMMQADPEAA